MEEIAVYKKYIYIGTGVPVLSVLTTDGNPEEDELVGYMTAADNS